MEVTFPEPLLEARVHARPSMCLISSGSQTVSTGVGRIIPHFMDEEVPAANISNRAGCKLKAIRL